MPLGPVTGRPVTALFGKLPAHGDFVRRGDPALVRRLDSWLTAEVERLAAGAGEAIDARLAALGRWAFVLPGGLAGVLAGSHDRVGRVFPVVACAGGGRAAAARIAGLLVEAGDALLDADAVSEALAGLADEPDEASADEESAEGGARWWRPLASDAYAFAVAALPVGRDFDRLFDAPDVEEPA